MERDKVTAALLDGGLGEATIQGFSAQADSQGGSKQRLQMHSPLSARSASSRGKGNAIAAHSSERIAALKQALKEDADSNSSGGSPLMQDLALVLQEDHAAGWSDMSLSSHRPAKALQDER